MFVELHGERDLAALLERSQTEPVVVFKHSTQCSRSADAHYEVEAFMSNHPEICCGLVLVIEDRLLSDSIEERFGILHESPQAFLFSGGSVIWHAHHRQVTAVALEEALGNQRVQA